MRVFAALLMCFGICSAQLVFASARDSGAAIGQSNERLKTGAVPTGGTTAAAHEAPDKCVPEGVISDRLTNEQLACIGEPYGPLIREVQAADPAADAKREAEEGEFGLLSFLDPDSSGHELVPPGIACAFDVPSALIRGGDHWNSAFFITDFIISEGRKLYEQAMLEYATAYNRTLVTHKNFPYPDICRPRTDEETDWRVYRDLTDFRRAPAETLPPPQSLHTAVRSHDLAATRRLLKNGANPDELDEWGFTALGWAVLTGRADLIQRLLAAGADPNRHREPVWISEEGAPTPLILAVNARALPLVRQLAAAGADVNLNSPNYRGQRFDDGPQGGPPLLAAVMIGDLDMVRFLLEKGADPDVHRGGYRGSALITAIKGERPNVVALLIKHGADIHLRDGLGLSAIQWAAGRKRVGAIIRMIAEAGGLADARSRAERTLWRAALERGRLEILADLIAFGANSRLLKSSEQERLRAHIDDDRHKDVLDLLTFADRRAAELESAIRAGDLGRVKAFYTGGAEIAEGRMRTGLIMAVEARRPKLVAWFLKRGADPLAPVYHAYQFWLHKAFPVRVAPLWPDPALVLAFSYGPVESVRLLTERSDIPSNTFKPWREPVLRAALGGYGSYQRFRALDKIDESSEKPTNVIQIEFKGHRDAEIVDLALELSGVPKRGYEADDFLGDICIHMSGFIWQQRGTELLERYLARGYRPRQAGDAPFTARRLGDRPAVQRCFEAGARQALLILRYGADPNEPGSHLLTTALLGLYRDAVYLEVIDELLKRGVDPNNPDSIVTLDEATPHVGEMELQAMSQLYSEAQQPEEDTDPEAMERRFEALKQEWRQRFAEARRLLLKHGAKTRAQLEQEGILEPVPEAKPTPAIPVR